jgi:hypothetical protein
VTRARWARNRGWAGASGRGRARDPLEVGIGRDLEVGDREVGGVVCRALAGSVRAGDPPREAVVSGGSLHMALNSCRDSPTDCSFGDRAHAVSRGQIGGPRGA